MAGSNLPIIPVIIGATAVGKTGVALEIADKLSYECVSCDSRQIYKYMNIGTAKPDDNELQGRAYHLIDFVEPDQLYSAAKFRTDAHQVYEEIYQHGSRPLLVGGTGLYLQSLTEGLFETGEADPERKMELEKLSNKQLYEILQELDPLSATKIPIGNKIRIIRAIEIFETTGKRKSYLEKDGNYPQKKYNYIIFLLSCSREKLYQIINERVDKMIDMGFIEEVQNLIKLGFGDSQVVDKTLGYKEIIRYIKGDYDLDRCVELIKQKTRNFAKRQVTWFKKTHVLAEIDIEHNNVVDQIYQRLREIKT